MAALSARGCTVLYTATLDEENLLDDRIARRRTVRAYRSDGKLLVRQTIWYKPDEYNPKGRRNSYPWSIVGDAKKTAVPMDAEKWANYFRGKGYVVVKGEGHES